MNIIMKPLLKVVMLSLVFSMPSITMAKVYKWTDEQGKTHYTATPPPAKLKAKTKEFKVNKTKSSSLTNISNKSGSAVENNPKELARNQCKKAVKKVPRLIEEMQRVLEKGYSSGEISEKDYKLAKSQIRQEQVKPQSNVSDCIKEFNKGGKHRDEIDNIANNSAKDALKLMAMGAALEQVKARINKK